MHKWILFLALFGVGMKPMSDSDTEMPPKEGKVIVHQTGDNHLAIVGVVGIAVVGTCFLVGLLAAEWKRSGNQKPQGSQPGSLSDGSAGPGIGESDHPK